MEKEPCTKFCGVLISSHEVMKLQSFEFGASDVITVNLQNISALVFFAPVVKILWKKKLHSFMVVFTISYELIML